MTSMSESDSSSSAKNLLGLLTLVGDSSNWPGTSSWPVSSSSSMVSSSSEDGSSSSNSSPISSSSSPRGPAIVVTEIKSINTYHLEMKNTYVHRSRPHALGPTF